MSLKFLSLTLITYWSNPPPSNHLPASKLLLEPGWWSSNGPVMGFILTTEQSTVHHQCFIKLIGCLSPSFLYCIACELVCFLAGAAHTVSSRRRLTCVICLGSAVWMEQARKRAEWLVIWLAEEDSTIVVHVKWDAGLHIGHMGENTVCLWMVFELTAGGPEFTQPSRSSCPLLLVFFSPLSSKKLYHFQTETYTHTHTKHTVLPSSCLCVEGS